MRAVVARDGAVAVESVPEPVPGTGHVLAVPLACGICGSDVHTLHVQAGNPEAIPPMVLGHEFCAEIVDHGPGTDRRLPIGTKVCSVPFLDSQAGPQLIGLSPLYPGGLAEQVLLQEHRLVAVPDHVPPEHAAVTEPLAASIRPHCPGRRGRPAHSRTPPVHARRGRARTLLRRRHSSDCVGHRT